MRLTINIFKWYPQLMDTFSAKNCHIPVFSPMPFKRIWSLYIHTYLADIYIIHSIHTIRWSYILSQRSMCMCVARICVTHDHLVAFADKGSVFQMKENRFSLNFITEYLAETRETGVISLAVRQILIHNEGLYTINIFHRNTFHLSIRCVYTATDTLSQLSLITYG